MEEGRPSPRPCSRPYSARPTAVRMEGKEKKEKEKEKLSSEGGGGTGKRDEAQFTVPPRFTERTPKRGREKKAFLRKERVTGKN